MTVIMHSFLFCQTLIKPWFIERINQAEHQSDSLLYFLFHMVLLLEPGYKIISLKNWYPDLQFNHQNEKRPEEEIFQRIDTQKLSTNKDLILSVASDLQAALPRQTQPQTIGLENPIEQKRMCTPSTSSKHGTLTISGITVIQAIALSLIRRKRALKTEKRVRSRAKNKCQRQYAQTSLFNEYNILALLGWTGN